MPGQHTEQALETAIEDWLINSGGYEHGDREAFDQERGLFPVDVISFIRNSQPEEWEYLANLQKDKAEETLLDDLCTEGLPAMVFRHAPRAFASCP